MWRGIGKGNWKFNDAKRGRDVVRGKGWGVRHLPGRAHPRTQGRSMSGGGVVGVMQGVSDDSRIRKPAQHEQACDQTKGQKLFARSGHDTLFRGRVVSECVCC